MFVWCSLYCAVCIVQFVRWQSGIHSTVIAISNCFELQFWIFQRQNVCIHVFVKFRTLIPVDYIGLLILILAAKSFL